MSRRLSWVLVALAGLSLLAGCGESEKDKYTNKIKSINKQVRSEVQQASGGKRASSLAEAATQLQRLQGVMNRVAQRFADVEAPSKVKDLHQRLTGVFRTFATSLSPTIQAANGGNVKQFQSKFRTFTTELVSFQSQLSRLNNDYKSRGYNLG
jgi:hypothetical protein